MTYEGFQEIENRNCRVSDIDDLPSGILTADIYLLGEKRSYCIRRLFLFPVRSDARLWTNCFSVLLRNILNVLFSSFQICVCSLYPLLIDL